jgi:hypothetical protein
MAVCSRRGHRFELLACRWIQGAVSVLTSLQRNVLQIDDA